MSDYILKNCSKCGQKLRFPKRIGGMLMACPSCGAKFASDFKIGGTKSAGPHGIPARIFELPSTFLEKIIRFFTSR